MKNNKITNLFQSQMKKYQVKNFSTWQGGNSESKSFYLKMGKFWEKKFFISNGKNLLSKKFPG